MIHVERLNLARERNLRTLTAFLEKNGLRRDPLDACFVLYDDTDMIGVCGRQGNVLKNFAIDPAYRGEALLDLLMTEMFKELYQKGYEDLFVYTKSKNAQFFEAYQFQEVADTGSVVLLHRGPTSPSVSLEAIYPSADLPLDSGAIVMNANPFTLGHRYLIETSAKKVARLYVFIVEHNGCRFSFEDRFRLVKTQTEDLENVVVLPSGDYSISQATFPSYFLKEQAHIDSAHAVLDALVFKTYYVPHFHIGTRFLGEEPKDPSTALYNKLLTKWLSPECKVEIIPRKEWNGQVISATLVRRALDARDLEPIRHAVPTGTYRYLESLL